MKKNQAATGISPAQWGQVRKHLRGLADDRGSIAALAEEIGVKKNTLVSFLLGRSKGLSQANVDRLRALGMWPTFDEDRGPLSEWEGETKTTAQAAEEKGVTPATIRRWCKVGKLHYIRKGRNYLVAIDEAYGAIAPTEKAVLRARVAALEAENAALKEQNAELKSKVEQLTFDFETSGDRETTGAEQGAAGTNEEIAARLGFYPVFSGEKPVGDWRMHCAGPNSVGVWQAARVNGTVSPASFRLPAKVSRKIEVDERRKRVVVPLEMAEKMRG